MFATQIGVIFFYFQLFQCICYAKVTNEALLLNTSADATFELMREAYYDEDWQNCADYGLAAVAQHRKYDASLLECRSRCIDGTVNAGPERYIDGLLTKFGSSVWHITCIERCKPANLKYAANFIAREPYDYIQICSYRLQEYDRGAAAATTFLVANPNHDYMQTNIKNYAYRLHVKADKFIDLEAGEYERLYQLGVDFYEGQNWTQQIQHISAALDSYHQSYNACSLLCEDGYEAYASNTDRNHEAVGAIADQIERAVLCKAKCRTRLSKLNLAVVDDIVANMYHHLQFAYSKVGDYKKGAEYAAAFLLLHPNHKNMTRNRDFLQNVRKVPEEWFRAPEREVMYKGRLDELDKTLKYLNTDYISQHSEGKPTMDRTRLLREFLGGVVKVNETAEKLGGSERFVADGFVTENECKHLINMCKKDGISGYTVGGAPSPFTKHEIIYGLRVNETHRLVEEDKMNSGLLSLYLDLSERTRRYTQLYFNLHELYFDFTHMVCRTAIDEEAERKDLSHPVHSDNCILQEDGTCHKGPPAFTHRDYSGLLYLNDDFKGGDFFFADSHKHEQAYVRPKCGRLVAFNAGDYHGVKAVQSGRRCAIAVWFTLSSAHEEQSRKLAADMLTKKREPRFGDEL